MVEIAPRGYPLDASETRSEVIPHSGRESGPDVPEDVHGPELPEVDGTVGRQCPLPDLLRHHHRSDSSADELQGPG